MDWLQFFSDLTKIAKAGVGGENDLPAILIGIVVAYLTILISVSIAIFSEKKDFEFLDRNVILDHIVKAKALLFFLGLAFFPLLFWNNSLPLTRLLEIVLWAIGVGLITKILIDSYRWMKGSKFTLRLSYLSEVRNKLDMEEAWRSVWQTENINSQNEHDFFNVFRTVVESSLGPKKVDLIIAGKLLGDFNNFIQDRSTIFLAQRNEVLNRTLEWHFHVWEKEHEYLSNEDEIEEWGMYNELYRTLDSVFRQIEERALTKRAPFAFFKSLEKHSEKYKDNFLSSQYYLEPLFESFYDVFFQHIHESHDRFNIWNHYFPKKWKVTKDNLQKEENIISNTSLYIFLNWARDRIWQTSEEKDFALDEVSRNLFPEVDPIIWARILIFVLSPDGDDRLRSVIEKPWRFGFSGRVKVYSPAQKGAMNSLYQSERQCTFELACHVFSDQFSTTTLENYIHSLEQLQYQEESVEERKRLTLITIFTNMLIFLKDNELADTAQSPCGD